MRRILVIAFFAGLAYGLLGEFVARMGEREIGR